MVLLAWAAACCASAAARAELCPFLGGRAAPRACACSSCWHLRPRPNSRDELPPPNQTHVMNFVQIGGIILGMLVFGALGDIIGRCWGRCAWLVEGKGKGASEGRRAAPRARARAKCKPWRRPTPLPLVTPRLALPPAPDASRIVASIMLSGSIMLVFSPLVQSPLPYLRFFIFAQTFYGFGVGGEARRLLISSVLLCLAAACVCAMSFPAAGRLPLAVFGVWRRRRRRRLPSPPSLATPRSTRWRRRRRRSAPRATPRCATSAGSRSCSPSASRRVWCRARGMQRVGWARGRGGSRDGSRAPGALFEKRISTCVRVPTPSSPTSSAI